MCLGNREKPSHRWKTGQEPTFEWDARPARAGLKESHLSERQGESRRGICVQERDMAGRRVLRTVA